MRKQNDCRNDEVINGGIRKDEAINDFDPVFLHYLC